MPSTIIFTPTPSGKAERLKVSDDPATTAEKLGGSRTGFVEFAPAKKPSETVWINRDQVRMIRAARETQEPQATEQATEAQEAEQPAE